MPAYYHHSAIQLVIHINVVKFHSPLSQHNIVQKPSHIHCSIAWKSAFYIHFENTTAHADCREQQKKKSAHTPTNECMPSRKIRWISRQMNQIHLFWSDVVRLLRAGAFVNVNNRTFYHWLDIWLYAYVMCWRRYRRRCRRHHRHWLLGMILYDALRRFPLNFMSNKNMRPCMYESVYDGHVYMRARAWLYV